MEYSINELAKLSGITTRTLRYYDEIGILSPNRISSNGYRIYGQIEVDLLQQILFYRELEIPLSDIKKILTSKNFDKKASLENHLSQLEKKRDQIELLIKNLEKTILTLNGGIKMTDKEKFEGFKKKEIEKNEEKYGKEMRSLYGDETIDKSNSKFEGMTHDQYLDYEKTKEKMENLLKRAVEEGNPSSDVSKEMCELHKKKICFFWSKYSKEAHMGLAQIYVDDPRFNEYYEKIVKGGAVFLRDAINIYCK
ncbi:MerR family transcriptional regulator [Peptostreptococcus faecalis]|uniref:MerR family transcriptional regulator n=1 Tax=Peptostreptococcus faecalis TaxID=2045015 RepID=UPI000C799B70|nr:MerR family transcriptional regulator [Peptostreptococcus faecalis]